MIINKDDLSLLLLLYNNHRQILLTEYGTRRQQLYTCLSEGSYSHTDSDWYYHQGHNEEWDGMVTVSPFHPTTPHSDSE